MRNDVIFFVTSFFITSQSFILVCIHELKFDTATTILYRQRLVAVWCFYVPLHSILVWVIMYSKEILWSVKVHCIKVLAFCNIVPSTTIKRFLVLLSKLISYVKLSSKAKCYLSRKSQTRIGFQKALHNKKFVHTISFRK